MPAFWESAACQGQYISQIFAVPGFHLSTIKLDWMHIVCLGILQYLLGNVIWECFIELGGTHSRIRQACSRLYNMIKIYCRHLGVQCPISKLTATMMTASASAKPKLKTKAAEGRHLLPVVRHLLDSLFGKTSAHALLRFQCVDALYRCYQEMDQWDTAKSPARLAQAARQHLLLYCELRMSATKENSWQLFPKHHLFIHLAEECVGNPRLEWNYLDESAIGEAAKMASSCNTRHIPTNVMEKHRLTFTLDCRD